MGEPVTGWECRGKRPFPGKADAPPPVALSSTLAVQAGVVQGKGQGQSINQIICQFLNCVGGLFFLLIITLTWYIPEHPLKNGVLYPLVSKLVDHTCYSVKVDRYKYRTWRWMCLAQWGGVCLYAHRAFLPKLPLCRTRHNASGD